MKFIAVVFFSLLLQASFAQENIFFLNETGRPVWIQKRTILEKGSFPYVLDSTAGHVQSIPLEAADPVMLNVMIIPKKGPYGSADGIYYLLKPNDTLLVRTDDKNQPILTHTSSATRTRELAFATELLNAAGVVPVYTLLKTSPRLYRTLMGEDLAARNKLIDSLSNPYINAAEKLAAAKGLDPQTGRLYKEHFKGMMINNKLFGGYNLSPLTKEKIKAFYAKDLEKWAAEMNCEDCTNIPFYNWALLEMYEMLLNPGNEDDFINKVAALPNAHNRNFLLSGYTVRRMSSGKDINRLIRTYDSLITDSIYKAAVHEQYRLQKDMTQLGSQELAMLMKTDNSKTGFTKLISGLKGKTIYIDFWASWCKPCIEELPYSHRLKERIKDSNIVLLYLSLDTDIKSWKASSGKNKLEDANSFLLLNPDNSKLSRQLKLGAIPRYIIISKEGKIVDPDAGRPSEEDTYYRLLELSKK